MQLYNSYMLQAKMHEKEIVRKQYERIFLLDQMGLTYKFLYIHKSRDQPCYPFTEEIFNLILESERRC